MQYLDFLINFLLILSLGYYLITNLQWYSYKLDRVILKHHKLNWHIIYFITPILFYYLLEVKLFLIYFIFFLLSLYLWSKNLDKKLIFTQRVKLFFLILIFVSLSINSLLFLKNNQELLIIPLFLSLFISNIIEKIKFISYKNKAKYKLSQFEDLTIIAITASYGKTSIKNYLYQVLSKKYNTYTTPRSVNTIAGIVKDINNDLPLNSEIYIVEAGAREVGDIKEITTFLNPQYIIIGQIGPQHLEYFKTIENIISTKMELLYTNRLRYGLIHTSIPLKYYDKEKIDIFPKNLLVTRSDLNGIWFDLEVDKKVEHFHTSLLGKFNASNLSAVILLAKKLSFSIDELKIIINELKPISHRLELIKTNNKLIIDDSFNGNFDGISEGIEIAKTYQGRKVIVTPGLVESTDELNKELAIKINNVFDLVILTSKLNEKVFDLEIDKNKLIKNFNKLDMTKILATHTKSGDLIYFANDAPSFI